MDHADYEQEDEEVASSGGISVFLPENIASLFRLFEMEITTRNSGIQHRVNTSKCADDILVLGKTALPYIYVFFCLPRKRTEIQAKAWCVILSWIANMEGIQDAPQDLEDIPAWLDWLEEYLEVFADPEDEIEELPNEKAAE